MRFSLVILACLATAFAFAADLEETTSASNSNIENGNDLSQTLFDKESGTNTFENSESSREGRGLDLANKTKNEDNEEAPIEEESESETKAFENSETVDEDEGVGVRDEDESGDNEEMATEEESEPENSNKVDENVDTAGEDENVMATEEESETETFENSETVDEDDGVDVVGKDGNEDKVTEEESETEGEINQNNGKDEGAEDEGLPSSQEGDEDIPTQPETPVFNDITEAPAPTEVEAPTSDSAPTPTNAARTPFPTVYNPPSLRPALPYISATDDPLEDKYDADGDGYDDRFDWFAKDSETIEELEHDKTVIIALSVTFGVMVFFSIFVAFQLLENPDGCCASICRISVACWCGLLRCICYPCRAMCGCTGPSHGEHMMVPDDGRFTHDLELS